MATSRIREKLLCMAFRLHSILALIACTSALASAAFTSSNSFTSHNHHKASPLSPRGNQIQQYQYQLNSLKNEGAETTTSFTSNTSTSASTTTTITTPIPSNFQICQAQYSDLAQAAELMTSGFHPELRNNPIMRPIRTLIELDRLQNNFPYEGVNGRHFYLVAYEVTNEGRSNTNTNNGQIKVIGFCDIDGRIPAIKSSKNNSSPFSLFITNTVNRPQPYFSDLSIHPNHRRQGIASALMLEAENRARSMGFEEMYLGVRSTNELALRMYSKIGYELMDVPTMGGDMLAFLEVQKDVRMLRRYL